MRDRLILISDDSDFFEYIIPKLQLRKSDELFRFSFKELPEKIHSFQSSLLIINSENNKAKTLDLLTLLKETPSIVFGYNEDKDFQLKAYKAGMFDYFSVMTPDEELKAKLIPALREITYLKQKSLYRELLIQNKDITENNEVFLSCNKVLDIEFNKIRKTSSEAVLMAISPDEKSKFIIQTNQIETVILNNIRKNDILLSYAPNKYFLLLINTNVDEAQNLWSKINSGYTEPVYAGFALVGRKNREDVVNEALNNLHRAISQKECFKQETNEIKSSNFKFYREEREKKLEQIIVPVFYRFQQLYNDKLYNMRIEQKSDNAGKELKLISKYITAKIRITCPGFSVVNIDITYDAGESGFNKVDENGVEFLVKSNSKRVKFNPDEFDAEKLENLLEEFMSEFKQYI